MDLNIISELNRLQEKRQALNSETDLSRHCDALVELDRKVGLLLDDIRNLHSDVQERFGFMQNVWENIEQPYKVLYRIDAALDLMIDFHKLSKICRRVDACPLLVRAPDGQLNLKNSIANLGGEEGENIDDNDDKLMLQMVQELLDSFETAYRPLEESLSERSDLPFNTYATRVRNLQKLISLQLKQSKIKRQY